MQKDKSQIQKALSASYPARCAHLFSREMELHCARLHSQAAVSSVVFQQPRQEMIYVRVLQIL